MLRLTDARRLIARCPYVQGVAVLFLLDIDVYLFEFWIPEQARARMEEFGAPVVRSVRKNGTSWLAVQLVSPRFTKIEEGILDDQQSYHII